MKDADFDRLQEAYDLFGVDGRLRDFADAIDAEARERCLKLCELHQELAAISPTGIDRIIALARENERMRHALMAARDCIALERTAWADDAARAPGEYDAVLEKIDAALDA